MNNMKGAFMIYKIKADYPCETIRIITGSTSLLEAKLIALTLPTDSMPYTLESIATKDDWERHTVNYCPRCGEHLIKAVSNSDSAFCKECDITFKAKITKGVQYESITNRP